MTFPPGWPCNLAPLLLMSALLANKTSHTGSSIWHASLEGQASPGEWLNMSNHFPYGREQRPFQENRYGFACLANNALLAHKGTPKRPYSFLLYSVQSWFWLMNLLHMKKGCRNRLISTEFTTHTRLCLLEAPRLIEQWLHWFKNNLLREWKAVLQDTVDTWVLILAKRWRGYQCMDWIRGQIYSAAFPMPD
jgi:hypothetical protein